MQYLSNTSETQWLESNKFLSGLKNNTINFDNFVSAQESFVNCVNYWSQILGKLIYMLDDFKSRRIILDNLLDEHGYDITGKYGSAHVETFEKFVTQLGGVIEHKKYDKPSFHFNGKLLVVSDYELPVFIATLGFIEYYYQKISSIIVNYLKANKKYNNIHYEEHELLDVKHYTDLFTLLNKYTNAEQLNAMEEGAKYAMHIFDTYYNSCYDLYCSG